MISLGLNVPPVNFGQVMGLHALQLRKKFFLLYHNSSQLED